MTPRKNAAEVDKNRSKPVWNQDDLELRSRIRKGMILTGMNKSQGLWVF